MKALRRPNVESLTRNDLVELTDKLKLKNDTLIFKRLGVKRYILKGSTYKVPGILALQGLPKRAPVRIIDETHWYSASEILDLYKQWASDKELEKLTRYTK